MKRPPGVLSQDFLSQAINSSFGDYRYEDHQEGDVVIAKRGDEIDVTVRPPVFTPRRPDATAEQVPARITISD